MLNSPHVTTLWIVPLQLNIIFAVVYFYNGAIYFFLRGFIFQKTKTQVVRPVYFTAVILINKCRVIYVIYNKIKIAIIIKIGIYCTIRKRRRLITPCIGEIIKLQGAGIMIKIIFHFHLWYQLEPFIKIY